ncbi:hypothetical protein AAFF_G00243800 [Aldrovandia affinis]|uniref:Uncharacterized protein n=1 Tax=Aldrovandia affinis TaxID=143900 RepID=A0AAD7RDQ5_9TELE|nr:hypothetical protein AAFF_G00243800 [Aldrovandia affinis]
MESRGGADSRGATCQRPNCQPRQPLRGEESRGRREGLVAVIKELLLGRGVGIEIEIASCVQRLAVGGLTVAQMRVGSCGPSPGFDL